MNNKRHKLLMKYLTLLGVISVLLSIVLMFPVAKWLSDEDLLDGTTLPDAIYVLAGQSSKYERIEAVVSYLSDVKLASDHTGYLLVLVGNDTTVSSCSKYDKRNLTNAEWTVRKLKERLISPGSKDVASVGHDLPAISIKIVPGLIYGTDDEMRTLADYLAHRPEIRQVALATSGFHIRRALSCIRRYAKYDIVTGALPPYFTWRDRAPWVAAIELFKLFRDKIGLNDAPLLTRRYYATGHGIVEWLVLANLAVMFYAWCLYPLFLAIFSGIKRRHAQNNKEHKLESCFVHILISAYNEELVIERRLKNLIELCNVSDIKYAVHIGLDACSDRTAEIANKFALDCGNIYVHVFNERRGKVAVLRDLVRLTDASGISDSPSVLMFTDANTCFRQDSLNKLLSHFKNPDVGCVCGQLVFTNPLAVATQGINDEESAQYIPSEGIYWKWENKLKKMESDLDSCLGANGAIYAVRRELFWTEIPANTIVDDFVIGMKVREKWKLVVYEPEAVAEEEFPDIADEWSRRVRIGAGDYQALVLCIKCALPNYGRFAWMFFSHKILRWFTPHAMLFVIVSSWYLVAREGWCFLIQGKPMSSFALALGTFGAGLTVLFVLSAILGQLFRESKHPISKPFHLCEHFLSMQMALLVGFFHYCGGGLTGYWNRTPRGNKSEKI